VLCDGSGATASFIKIFKKNQYIFYINFVLCNPCRAVQQLSKFLKDINIFFLY